MQIEQQAMQQLMPSLVGQIVLDLACGTGRYGLLARDSGAKQVVGLDNSVAMLRGNALPHLALAPTDALPLADASVDVVLCGLALGHVPQLSPSIAEIGRVLRPGGTALISDFHPFIFFNGQRRTFTTPGGQTFAVEHYAHLYSAYHQAAADAGLRIDAVHEPTLRDANDPQIKTTGLPAETPVAIVYRMKK
ncbi:MAG: class I SAM-dependent methyltransferase [Chloroflexi bacterium]|nr:MAG: class I SAM-dependent methyltransferase [Chloroflexota bacterium]